MALWMAMYMAPYIAVYMAISICVSADPLGGSAGVWDLSPLDGDDGHDDYGGGDYVAMMMVVMAIE